MASLSAPSDFSVENCLKQARAAIERQDSRTAYQYLQQAIKIDPGDYRAWLWLAVIDPSPQNSEKYVERAEILAPAQPRVLAARQWVDEKLQKVSKPARLPSEKKDDQRPENNDKGVPLAWLGGALFIILLLLGIFLWSRLWNQSETAVARQTTVVAETFSLSASNQDTHEVAPVSNELPQLAGVPVSTPEPHIPAKQIGAAGRSEPRATWTATPIPSPTPTPSPTWVPTHISPGGKEYNTRPFGLGPEEKWIDVDLSDQSLTAYLGNTAVFETFISSGTIDHATVTGQFRIWLMYESQTMDGTLLGYDYYLEDVPYVMYFYHDYALHGAYWHSNFGTEMSHGCVNMDPGDAGWIYSWASIGTLVNVHD